MQRRLAAVLAADIVGYTRLMGADQDGALAALRTFRAEVFGPLVSDHGGVTVKSMGDGWLVEFAAAVDAVACALAIQDRLRDHPTLRLRIGISLGDIVRENEDIFGTGVNVAARLQEAAPPRGIAISATVHDSLDGTLAPAFTDAGHHTLKNVARPVHVWMHLPEGATADLPGATHLASYGIARLAILPIVRAQDRSDLADLAEGLTGDLLALLETSDWIAPRVTGQPRAGDFSLMASLRARGDRLRLDLQLVAPSGEVIWPAAFDGDAADTFEWQDRVAAEVAANVAGAMLDAERARLLDTEAGGLSARDLLECGVLEFFEVSHASLVDAMGYLAQAIRRAPDQTAAHARAIRCVVAALVTGHRTAIAQYLPEMPGWLDRVEEAGQPQEIVDLAHAIVAHVDRPDWQTLEHTALRALSRLPQNPDVLCIAGWCLVWLGQPDRAIDCFRRFRRAGRFNVLAAAARAGMALALVQAGRDHEAMEEARPVLRATPEFAAAHAARAAAAAHAGAMADARDALARGNRIATPLLDPAHFADTPANSRLFEGLRLAAGPG